MNDELKNLYQKHWVQLLKAAENLNTNAANPLLIKVDEDYINSAIKVMIVGQETDSWHGVLNQTNKSVDDLMRVDDLMQGYFDYFHKKSKNGGKRAFWNKKNYKYFEKELTKYFKDQDKNKKVSFIWNNISKIGNDGRGKPKKEIQVLERKHFNILKEEFGILKPNIVIFTTGQSRDGYIKHHFGSETEMIPVLYRKENLLLEESQSLIVQVKIHEEKKVCSVRVEHPGRRTLDNSIIMDVIKDIWESNK